MICLKTTFHNQFTLLSRLHHLSKSFFSFSSFCLAIGLGFTQLYQNALFPFLLPNWQNDGLPALLNSMCSSYDSSLLPILGIFPTAGGVKSDEDDHRSVCSVSGVLTLLEEEERKKIV